ncbi:DUF401 family protein [Desulfosporosinus sp.]|uniref:DUF401 family protein n=1 Tax=Desulfosporosinus sp. TaxID=157907 RepID=UPI0025B80581|nr:DUF401 family protein [Desulfosporosinus sp.]MBC2724649.1 DUF401 family protein [Desulfosporosinus sp.]MBC2724935.1 DUF401 family protein [Desulfosporosinus sp.]
METAKLLIVFIVMMVLLWRKIPLVYVVIGASIVLAFLFGTDITGLLGMAWDATKDPSTIEIEAILVLIMILEQILRQKGYLERMLNSLTRLIKDRRIVMAIIPAFIGLMPSAGGALFSAPLVEQAVGKSVPAVQKTFINFYYRHIWEFFLPLYTGVLLVSTITGIPLTQVLLGLMPYGILVILLGLPFLFRIKVDEELAVAPHLNSETMFQSSANNTKKKLLTDVFFSTLPVLALVGLVFAKVPITLAITIIIAVLILRHKTNLIEFYRIARKAIVIKTLIMIWGIMLFKQVMETVGSFDELPALLGSLPVPEFLIFALIAFLLAFLTGQTGSYIGIAFPIVMAASGGQVSLPLAILVFMAGSAGTMLSPMHLCLSLTIEYFKADLNKVLQMLIIPESILVGTAILSYLILS